MLISYSALLAAGLMPVVCAGIAKAGAARFDNHDPRRWLSEQTGYRARANAAQANCFEAFPFFAVGVVLALMTGVDTPLVDLLGAFFIAMRIAYVACYVMDKAMLRTVFWSLAYLAVLGLYALSIKLLSAN